MKVIQKVLEQISTAYQWLKLKALELFNMLQKLRGGNS